MARPPRWSAAAPAPGDGEPCAPVGVLAVAVSPRPERQSGGWTVDTGTRPGGAEERPMELRVTYFFLYFVAYSLWGPRPGLQPGQPRTQIRPCCGPSCVRALFFLQSSRHLDGFLVDSSAEAFLSFLAGGMDWAAASGAPSWGAAATDPGPTMLSFAGPSSSTSSAAEAEGRLIAAGLVQSARPAGAGRWSRAAGGGAGAEACSVDGCRSDLSRCREYHRRHKVCEAHSKTPVVVVAGQEQRFCQQCSRFHMLSEFDEGKRSCRKRLDVHNRRRRKPQHDLMNLGGFFPYHQVNQFEVNPRTSPTVGQSSDAMHLVGRQQPFSIWFSRAPNQLPFPHGGGSELHAARPGLLAECSSHTGSSTRNKALSGMLGPECALSLLSSSLHRPSAGQPQVASSLSRIAVVSQAATTAMTTALAAGVGHHVFVPDDMFEDPSQALPFPWQ